MKEHISLLKTSIKCVRLLAKHEQYYVILSIVVTMILGVLPIASVIIMQQIVNFLQLGNLSFNNIATLVLVYVSIDLTSSIVSSLYTHYSMVVNLRFSKQIEIQMIEKATNLSIENYEESELYNIISRARSEGPVKIWSFFSNVILLGKQFISLLCSVTVISVYRPSLIIIVLIPPVVRYYVSFKLNKLRFRIYRSRTTRERKAWYITHLVFTGIAFKEIKLFGIQDYIRQKYSKYREMSISEDIELSRKVDFTFLGFNIIDNIVGGVLFLYIIFCGYAGAILIGDVITYTKCLFNVKNGAESTFSLFDTMAKDALFVRQFFEFMDIKEIKNRPITIETIDQITVKNLSFKYKNSDSHVLRHISFDIKKGESLLIVGLNGAGKTTLMKLLLGFYETYDGDIIINGINLKDIDKSSYYKQISGVFQDCLHYETSLRENIALSNVSQIEDDDLIYQALELADLSDLFDNNLNIVLGSWFDEAVQLSGGQWQKVGLARAFFKKSSLYILDEPDSALDVSTEHFVLDKFFETIDNCIGICSSHRFSRMCFYADKILVIDGGEIVEQGNHKQLLEKKGIYYELYQQAHNFDVKEELGIQDKYNAVNQVMQKLPTQELKDNT